MDVTINVPNGSYTNSAGVTTNNGTLTIMASGAVSLGNISVGTGAIAVTAGGAISQTGSIIQTGPGTAVSFTAGANPITLALANQISAPVSLSNSGANAVTLTVTGRLNLGGVTVGTGPVTLTATTGMGQAGGAANAFTQAAGGGLVTVNAGDGSIDFSNTLNQLTGPVSVNNMGAHQVVVKTVGALTLAASSLGTLTGLSAITAGGPITQTGAFLTAPGSTVTVSAGANPITLTNAGKLAIDDLFEVLHLLPGVVLDSP